MGVRSIVLTTVTALVAAIVGVPAPALAASADDHSGDRGRVVALWHFGGPAVRAAAEHALAGSDADVESFLATGLAPAQATDRRISVDRMLSSGGPAMQTAAQQALDSTNAGALTAFLGSGWQTPWANDQRLRVDQMLAVGGSNLQQAAQRALDDGSVAALQEFLKSGWQTPYATDQRIRVDQILADGGPEVKKVAQEALDAGTADALNRFLDTDWAVAQARDQETATVAQLAGIARDAGEEAARETAAAKEATDKAVAEAELARQAAQAAAQAAANAHGDANAAAAAAGQAARAANNAAAAAREAIGAANAASSAARVAASAAARAATAASMAGQAAARAYSAAASAATDASQAAAARQAAQNAREVAAGAQKAADAAAAAGDAAKAAGNAALAAGHAGNEAAAAADASAQASRDAANAGADAAAARAAAATARADADRANRAATAAQGFADTAANAAYAARDAANRATQDANAAAAAADDAANHAGQAADAAKQATDHANAATAAAQRAIDAANQAQQVYDAARQADAQRVATTAEQADEAALQASAAAQQDQKQVAWNATQAAKRDAETNRLLAEATAAGTDPAVAVTDARKVALALATSSGSWTREAALTALAGTNDQVMDYVRSGVAIAAGQDDRVTLADLEATGTDNFRAAAGTALAGSDADVASFLQNPTYPQRYTDDRIAVDQVLSAALQAGNIATQQAAQTALDAGTDQALRDFLKTGQYTAASADERIVADQILADPNSGPELTGAAQAALDGPPGMLHQFLVQGRYIAAQHDADSAAHVAEVAGYLKQASEAAQTASQNANEAQAAAATARGAAADAANYAQQAQNDASQAAIYAQQAHDSAAQAEASAQQAAASAATAKNAAAAATASANQAARSAIWAESSARQASGFASDAYRSATQAFNSAVAAGQDALKAAQAFTQAVQDALGKLDQEKKDAQTKQAVYCTGQYPQGTDGFNNCIHLATASDEQLLGTAYAHGLECSHSAKEGSPAYQNCLRDVLSLTFEDDQTLNLLEPLAEAILGFTITFAGLTVGMACLASEVCGAIVLSITPDGAALAPGLAGLAGSAAGAISGTRIAAIFEEAMIDAEAAEVRLGDEASEAAERGLLKTSCEANSFTGDTQVLMANGTTKKIKDVRLGDNVLAKDPVRSANQPYRVSGLIVGQGIKSLVDVTVDGTASVQSTRNHLFWSTDRRAWTAGDLLTVGERLETPSGRSAIVTATRRNTENVRVYNLTVTDVHNYYVLAGGVAVLVHNADCFDPALDAQGEIYIKGKHVVGGVNVDFTKGLFDADVDLDALAAQSTQAVAIGPNPAGFYERAVDAGRLIGVTSEMTGRQPTSWYMLVQDKWGGVVTMYPIAKPIR